MEKPAAVEGGEKGNEKQHDGDSLNKFIISIRVLPPYPPHNKNNTSNGHVGDSCMTINRGVSNKEFKS